MKGLMELVAWQKTAPGPTLVAATAIAGAGTVRVSKRPRLVAAWADKQDTGVVRLLSAYGHDQAYGIAASCPAGISLVHAGPVDLIPLDTISVYLTGSATAGDIETICALIAYDDVPGVAGRFLRPSEAMRAASVIGAITSISMSVALGTSGGFSGETALSAQSHSLKPGSDYAVIGLAVSSGETAAIRIRAADWGNLGWGLPGVVNSANMSIHSRLMGLDLPMYPVFNATQLSNVLVDGITDENGTDCAMTIVLVELGAGRRGRTSAGRSVC